MAGFGDLAEVSDIYYALSPCKFAVKSYLHYRRPGNGAALVRRLLEPDSAADTGGGGR